MRNGNKASTWPVNMPKLFLPYLWGMETSIFFASSSSFFCSYRTYEEWKLYHAITFLSVLRTRSYRTYEEWKLVVGHKIAISKRVLTVPMRNGNPFSLLLCHGRLRSYRTYEEWKLLTIPLALRLDKFVLTVPMRNGNPCQEMEAWDEN